MARNFGTMSLLLVVVQFFMVGCGNDPDSALQEAMLPSVTAARALSSHYVEVTFADPTDDVAEAASNYVITAPDGSQLRVLSARLGADGLQVVLTTDEQQKVRYALAVPGAASLIDPASSLSGEVGSLGFMGSSDREPLLESAISLDNTHVLLTFSERMDKELAENVAFYRIADPDGDTDLDLDITLAELDNIESTFPELDNSETMVVLTTSPQENIEYTVKATNVKSRFTCADGELVLLDNSPLGPGDLCTEHLNAPLTTDGLIAPFSVTARTLVDPTDQEPDNPYAGGVVGAVYLGACGAGVKVWDKCSGSESISGDGTISNEELIFTFDDAFPADRIVLGLAEIDFITDNLYLFVSTDAAPDFDYTVTELEIRAAYHGTGQLRGDVYFGEALKKLSVLGVKIDEFKVRATTKSFCVFSICFTDGRRVDPTRSTVSFFGIPENDTTPPTVLNAVATENTSVLVSFSEPLGGTGIQNPPHAEPDDPSNYKITADACTTLLCDDSDPEFAGLMCLNDSDCGTGTCITSAAPDCPELTVTTAMLTVHDTQVLLTTLPQTANIDYVVTVSNVRDKAGNPIKGASWATFSGIPPVDTSPPRVVGAKVENETKVSAKPPETTFTVGGDVKVSLGVEHTSNVTSTSARATQQVFENSFARGLELSQNRSVTREVFGASLDGSITIENPGDIAFTISNIELSVLEQGRTRDSFVPVATLLPNSTLTTGAPAVFNIGPFDEPRGPILFSSRDVFPNLVEDLMRSPRGLLFRLANFDITDEFGRNLAFASQEVNDRTAGLTIDPGDGTVERYFIATNGSFDDKLFMGGTCGDDSGLLVGAECDDDSDCGVGTCEGAFLGGFDEFGTPLGIPMDYILQDILKLVKNPTTFNAILAGPDKKATSIAVADDIQVVPPATEGLPERTIIVLAGEDGILQTVPNNANPLNPDLDDFQAITFGYETSLTCNKDTERRIVEPMVGGDGIASTPAVGDDEQEIPVGEPANPGDIIISAGPNGVLDSVQKEDDQVRGPAEVCRVGIIEPDEGGNGVADTEAAADGDDIQVVAVGDPAPAGYVIIRPGPNGVLETVPDGDDQYPFDCPGGACDGREVLVRFKNSSTAPNRFWIAFTSEEIPVGTNFGDFLMKPAEAITIVFGQDIDRDGLFAREEFTHGSNDQDKDSDDDRLGDFSEIRIGWLVDVPGRNPERVYPDPRLDDSDGDGIWDDMEQTCRTDPRRRDTDDDGLRDDEELDCGQCCGLLGNCAVNNRFCITDDDCGTTEQPLGVCCTDFGDATEVVYEVEPNDVFGSATGIGFGNELAGTIASNTDDDWFRFDADSEKVVRTTFVGSTSGLSFAAVDLFDQDGTSILQSGGEVLFRLKRAGAYFLKVRGTPSGADPGTYKLWLRGCDDFCHTDGDCAEDETCETRLFPTCVNSCEDVCPPPVVPPFPPTHLDPRNADTDGDSLGDGLEIDLGADPLDPYDAEDFIDSDADGMPDSEENAGYEITVMLSENTCGGNLSLAHNGSCNDDSSCPYGTDCDDCGPRAEQFCSNSCSGSANNGFCDDGGPGSVSSQCAWGTDCDDCGARGRLVFTDLLEPDTDFDGLPDLVEKAIGTDAEDVDTDGDGLLDYDEFADFGQFLALNFEYEGFSLSDADSQQIGTDPASQDTDGDELSDDFELLNGWRVLSFGDDDAREVVSDPLFQDTDLDQRTDIQEYLGRNNTPPSRDGSNQDATDPTDPDTDGDGRLDGEETGPPSGSDPLLPDLFVTVRTAGITDFSGPHDGGEDEWRLRVWVNNQTLTTEADWSGVSFGTYDAVCHWWYTHGAYSWIEIFWTESLSFSLPIGDPIVVEGILSERDECGGTSVSCNIYFQKVFDTQTLVAQPFMPHTFDLKEGDCKAKFMIEVEAD